MSTSSFSRNQAMWRSRRGLLELDLYLTPFAEACFDDLSTELKQRFGELLECEDPEILDWLKSGVRVPCEYLEIVTEIKKFSNRRPHLDRE